MLTGRRAERLNALVEELSTDPVHGLVVDVRDRKGMTAVANLPPSFATLRGLINNAGLAVGADPAPKCNLRALGNHGRHQHQGPADHHPPAAAPPDRPRPRLPASTWVPSPAATRTQAAMCMVAPRRS